MICLKLERFEYLDIVEFNKDVKLVWSNAIKFHDPASCVYKAAGFLARTWRQKFAILRNDSTHIQGEGGKTTRSPRLREREDLIKMDHKKANCGIKFTESTQEVMGTDRYSKWVGADKMKKPEGLSSCVTGGSPSTPTRNKSTNRMDDLKNPDITLSPLCSASLLETTNSMKKFDVENTPMDKRVINPTNILYASIGKEQVLSDLVPHLVNAKGIVNEMRVREMTRVQLIDLGNKIGLVFPQKGSIAELQKQTIFRLEWLGKQSVLKDHAALSWVPPVIELDKPQKAKGLSAKSVIIKPVSRVPLLLDKLREDRKVQGVLDALRAENAKLLDRLEKSESFRREMEKKLNQRWNSGSVKDDQRKITGENWTRSIRTHVNLEVPGTVGNKMELELKGMKEDLVSVDQKDTKNVQEYLSRIQAR